MTLRLSIENMDRLPDGGPLRIEVKGRGLDFGRDAHLDWTLPDPSRTVSSKHCEVRFRDGGYWLHDVSTNGTFVNGSQFRLDAPYLLRDGDRLNIGPYIIAVSVEGQKAAAAGGAFDGAERAGGRRMGRGRRGGRARRPLGLSGSEAAGAVARLSRFRRPDRDGESPCHARGGAGADRRVARSASPHAPAGRDSGPGRALAPPSGSPISSTRGDVGRSGRPGDRSGSLRQSPMRRCSAVSRALRESPNARSPVAIRTRLPTRSDCPFACRRKTSRRCCPPARSRKR